MSQSRNLVTQSVNYGGCEWVSATHTDITPDLIMGMTTFGEMEYDHFIREDWLYQSLAHDFIYSWGMWWHGCWRHGEARGWGCQKLTMTPGTGPHQGQLWPGQPIRGQHCQLSANKRRIMLVCFCWPRARCEAPGDDQCMMLWHLSPCDWHPAWAQLFRWECWTRGGLY